jgi:lipopolysaccharide transport system ATP-binding protein
MTENAIVVENLSKRYQIGHRFSSGAKYKYTALRDIIGREIGNFTRKAADVVRGRAVVQGDEIEEFWALKDVSFEVKQGEVIGIIGRNGAGKSTLLKILSRITEPTEGRVLLGGRVASLLEVGTGFHPELTGRENIFLNGAILGMTQREIRRKFDEIVAFAEIDKFLDTPVKHYSSGMYVRLAFAVAAHLEPEILIVDEVLAVGDTAFQEKCIGKMNSVAESEGRTVLFVSHNMAAIQHLCARAILIQSGRVTVDGQPETVIGSYLSDAGIGSRVDLANWKDRITSGEARITELEIGDASKGSAITFGGELRVKIHARFNVTVVDPSFGVVVHDSGGTPLLVMRSIHDGLCVGGVSGNIIVEMNVPSLNLYPGRYLLSVFISDSASQTAVDFPRLCSAIRIRPGAGPHGDLKLDPNWGKYFVPSHWKLCVPH